MNSYLTGFLMLAYLSSDCFSFREIWCVTDLLGFIFDPQVHSYAHVHSGKSLYYYWHLIALVSISSHVGISETREQSYLHYCHQRRAEIIGRRFRFGVVSWLIERPRQHQKLILGYFKVVSCKDVQRRCCCSLSLAWNWITTIDAIRYVLKHFQSGCWNFGLHEYAC